MKHYSAIKQNGGKWAVAEYNDSNCHFVSGVPMRKRHIILAGLSQDDAIARAAALNGCCAITQKQPIHPRHRVGIRTS